MFRNAGVCAVAVAAALMTTAGCQSDANGGSDESAYGGSSTESSPASASVTVPEGTTFVVTMDSSLSSDESRSGDPFLAHLQEPIRSGGEIVVPAGAEVRGRVAEVRNAEETSLILDFTEVETGGEMHALDVKPIELIAEPEGPSDAAVVLGAGAAGAVIGAAIDGGKGAAIGGVGGVTAGTIAVIVRGHDVEVPQGQRIALRLESPASLPARG